MNMPIMSGTEMTQEIRSRLHEEYIHIIMISGNWNATSRQRALDVGADDFIEKGPDNAMMQTKLRTASRLVHHQSMMAQKNHALNLAQKQIANDMAIAKIAQRRLLESVTSIDTLPDCDCNVHSVFVPSASVSGDMFGVFKVSEDLIGFYLLDVSGHGVHAALMSVAVGHLITPEYFRKKATLPDGAHDPAGLVKALNDRFYHEDSDDYFTMFCAIANVQSGQMTFCQAGNPSPLVRDNKGNVSTLGEGGFPVAMLLDAEFTNETYHFEPGSAICLFSDAAIEADNEQNEQFGADRLRASISEFSEGDLSQLPQFFVERLQTWRNRRDFDDDLTIVVLERAALT
ncbi:Phosphoserine phosphatase RsbP [Pseudoprimorskyibacter insulae]|uniref:Phosphoserine phosphatase RsbP n=2 Tax=Pseudoprimorskyibacter insulae TaxID=1695997 RepID=A0A2R8B0M4_9RHOB|nr:Phosphoserine phosphatase RsbP [Pseudoprimorskyibacter insulae]